jgi:hypothetical protein
MDPEVTSVTYQKSGAARDPAAESRGEQLTLVRPLVGSAAMFQLKCLRQRFERKKYYAVGNEFL